MVTISNIPNEKQTTSSGGIPLLCAKQSFRKQLFNVHEFPLTAADPRQVTSIGKPKTMGTEYPDPHRESDLAQIAPSLKINYQRLMPGSIAMLLIM